MIYREINLIELFNLIDEWYDNGEHPYVKVENTEGKVKEGEITFVFSTPQLLEGLNKPIIKPGVIRVDEKDFSLRSIKSIETGCEKYVIIDNL